MIGGKTGTRLFDGEPFTKYTVEIFPSAPEGGARGGSFNPAWMPSVQLPEAIYGIIKRRDANGENSCSLKFRLNLLKVAKLKQRSEASCRYQISKYIDAKLRFAL
jgi:hypothetical protein